MLTLEGVVKHYPAIGAKPVRAVDGVSLEIQAGELLALYGPSGSGKSTLLLLIAALMRPDAGSIHFDGRDISELSARDAARYRMHDVGVVRQSVELVAGLSALDNAALKLAGNRIRIRDAERGVGPLLERLGLGDRFKHREHELSMGERQRVMIARALSTNPRLVLADEPTGSLDTRQGRAVLELLADICRERQTGMLLVTHDPQAADVADSVMELRDGRLGMYEPGLGRTERVGL
ncbi:MAG TPA: ABC transporter ATP-binding protein [Thermoleophilaceae bacterium]